MNDLKKMKIKFPAKSSFGMFMVLTLGLTVTAILYMSESKSVEQRINSMLTKMSLERIQTIKQEIHENLNINVAISSFFQASNKVTREEFGIFVSHYFLTHHDIQALEWIPIVRSSEKEAYIKRAQDDGFVDFRFSEKNPEGELVPVESRAEYYPVYYIEPLSGNEKALGYDLGSDSTRLNAILKARESGEITITGRIDLVQKSKINFGVLIFEPVYKYPVSEEFNKNSQAPEGRKLIGFALGVYTFKDIIADALSKYPDVDLDITLFDLSAPSGQEFLTVIHELGEDEDLSDHYSLSVLKEEVNFSESFAVANRQWEIVFTPRKEFIEAIPNRSEFILISGLLLSFLAMIAYRYVTVNLSERKQDAQLLLESEQQLSEIYNTVGDIIYYLTVEPDECFRFKSVNQTFLNATGLTRDQVIGKRIEEVIPEQNIKMVKDNYKEAIEQKKIVHWEETSEFPTGLRVGDVSIAPIFDKNGICTNLIGSVHDITENKKASRALQSAHDKLESRVKERTKELNKYLTTSEEARDYVDGILKAVADGLVVTDMDNRVIMMNRAAEDLLDVKFSEVINKPIEFAIIDKTLREKIKETLNKKTTGYSFDFEWAGDNESKDILRARTSVILDKHGGQTGIITVFHDVTHEREVDRMKNEFISMAAHELRTPLTSIRGFSEILLTRDKLKPSDKTKYLTYIQDQSEVLSKIISDLLDISRIESGKSFLLHKDKCLLGDAIMQIAQPYIEKMPKNSVRVQLPKKEIELFLDKEKMAQVLENLLSNAIKYSPEKVDIDITAEIKGEYLHVIMEDRGIGMTPDQLGHIYDKFYRANISNTAITGTGLGLSIAKAIIEAHEGKIWIESKFGKGTKVSFSVPMHTTEGNIVGSKIKAEKEIID